MPQNYRPFKVSPKAIRRALWLYWFSTYTFWAGCFDFTCFTLQMLGVYSYLQFSGTHKNKTVLHLANNTIQIGAETPLSH